jgi:hypothetical protein
MNKEAPIKKGKSDKEDIGSTLGVFLLTGIK